MCVCGWVGVVALNVCVALDNLLFFLQILLLLSLFCYTCIFLIYLIQRLPATLDQHAIHGDRQRLLAQLRVVTKRVFAGILEKQSSCLGEMDRVAELQGLLGASLTTCRSGRRGLAQVGHAVISLNS